VSEFVSEIVPETVSYFALIPAAGVGARMGGACPKQYLPLHGKAMLWHTVQAFLNSSLISHVFVVVSKEDAYVDQLFPHNLHRLTVLRCGGATRQASVSQGLQAIREQVSDSDWVLVHDAARPGLTQALILRLVQAVRLHPVGGLLGLPVVDTVKQVQAESLRTLDRRGLWLAQTPQMFRYHLLVQALQQALENAQVTDESSAVEALGYVPLLVAGHARNFKLTLPEDVAMMEAYLTCIAAT
jgi:2-C-methyl-D-erythritol 4-phosphate cytidylyltransferase